MAVGTLLSYVVDFYRSLAELKQKFDSLGLEMLKKSKERNGNEGLFLSES